MSKAMARFAKVNYFKRFSVVVVMPSRGFTPAHFAPFTVDARNPGLAHLAFN